MTLHEELKAIDDIRQLKSRYFRFLDTKDWTGMATIFCREAIFDLRAGASVDPNDGSPASKLSADAVFHGVDTIVNYLGGAVAQVTTVHHGHCHEVWVDSPTDARGIIAMEDRISHPQTGALVLHGHGHYHETYRHEAGAWRIWRSKLSRLKVTLGASLQTA